MAVYRILGIDERKCQKAVKTQTIKVPFATDETAE
jgi:hypothetical protein